MDNRNLEPNIPVPVKDLPASYCGDGGSQLTSSSAVTSNYDCFKEFIINDHFAPGSSTEWTDEKHSLYISSLEASFVNQLHCSVSLRGGFWDPYSSAALQKDSCNSSHKSVLRGGLCNNANYKRNKSLSESTADSHFIQENQYTSHLSSAGKRHVIVYDGLQHAEDYSDDLNVGRVCCISEQHSASSQCHCDLGGNALEVSDQNFIDEEQGEQSSHFTAWKRSKIRQ